MGRHRTKKQADSRTVHIQGKKHVCGGRKAYHVWLAFIGSIRFQRMVELCPQACRFLKLNHHIHSPLEKSIIEMTMRCIKDRTGCFEDYFPCNRKRGCNFFRIKNWLSLFATMRNKEMLNA
jgi:hypothetical protein